MSSYENNLVQQLADHCKRSFDAPNGAGPHFWGNVVRCILLEAMVPTASYGDEFVQQLAWIHWRAERESFGIVDDARFDELPGYVKDSRTAGILAVLAALAAMPVEMPTVDEIAQAWNYEPSPVAPKVNVFNMLRARLAPFLVARAATATNQRAISIEDFAEALDLAATALPYDKRRCFNFDERFGKLVAKLESLCPERVVGASVLDQALGGAMVAKDAAETPKRATLMDRFHEATGTKGSTDDNSVSLGDVRELIRLLDT